MNIEDYLKLSNKEKQYARDTGEYEMDIKYLERYDNDEKGLEELFMEKTEITKKIVNKIKIFTLNIGVV